MVAEPIYSPEALRNIHSVSLQNTSLPCWSIYADSYSVSNKPHAHIGIEVLYCLEGDAVMAIDGKRVPIRDRTLTVLNPLKRHAIRATPGTRYRRYVLHLLPERLRANRTPDGNTNVFWPWTPWGLVEPVWQANVDEGAHGRVTRIFEEILYESTSGLPSSVEMISHLVNQLLIIVRRLMLAHNLCGVEEQKEDEDLIRSITAFIETHYSMNIRTSELAASLGYSPSRACHAFKRATGKTITRFLHEVRIQRAKNLLLLSSQQIAPIAYEVGYNDLSYFNRWFRAITGLSPSEYRRQFRRPAAPS